MQLPICLSAYRSIRPSTFIAVATLYGLELTAIIAVVFLGLVLVIMIVNDYELLEVPLGNWNRKFELRKESYKPESQ